jgi:hypothetical protein
VAVILRSDQGGEHSDNVEELVQCAGLIERWDGMEFHKIDVKLVKSLWELRLPKQNFKLVIRREFFY